MPVAREYLGGCRSHEIRRSFTGTNFVKLISSKMRVPSNFHNLFQSHPLSFAISSLTISSTVSQACIVSSVSGDTKFPGRTVFSFLFFGGGADFSRGWRSGISGIKSELKSRGCVGIERYAAR